MAYSITTKDGITLNGIPDDMPADHPDLKARIATIRGQGAAPAPAPSEPALPTAPTVGKGGAVGGIAMGLRDPVDAGAQILRRIVPEGVGKAVDTFGNWLADKGLPVARSDGVKGVDNVVKTADQEYEQSRKLAGRDGIDLARIAGNVVNPVNVIAAPEMAGANTIKALALAGAKAGAVGGVMQPVTENTDDFWSQKAKQAAAGAATGAVATPALVKGVVEPAANMVSKVAARLKPAPAMTTEQTNIAVNNIFGSQGMNLAEVPQVIRDSVARQAAEALASRQKMDPAAMVRKAQFEAVGLTGDAAPTLGQATRDSMQFANEKNLSGVRIKTPQGEGNPLADRFALQNKRLQDVFDLNGAAGATDRTTAGQTLVDALKAADVPVKGAVDQAYTAARGMNNGRAAELERGTFSQAANQALDEGMLGHALPADVRSLLNDVSSGKTPFNVDAAVQIDTILSRAQRAQERAGNDNAKFAIGKVRDALHATPLSQAEAGAQGGAARAAGEVYTGSEPMIAGAGADRTVPAVRDANPVSFNTPQMPGAAPRAAPPVDNGQAARDAFDQARAAARNRFATIEQTPALKAALDDAAPDKFVQQFVLGADARDVQSMKKVLENSPEALAQARSQIAATLKRAAFGDNQSGDAGFAAARYANALQAIGKQKLEVFFTPAEIVRMNLAGKVASDINSVPAGARYAVNSSGTGAAVMNLLSKVSEAPFMRQVPGARMLANQIGEIQTERAVNRALKAPLPEQEPHLPPETVRALQRLFPAIGIAGGSLGGAAGQ